jgi:type IV secretory pathway VirD2 relaxase
MIVKSKNVRPSRVSQKKASSSLKSHFKYIQYRERNLELESKEDRHVFDKQQDHIDRRAAHDQVMGTEPAGDIYYHRMILSPSHEEPVEDLRQWTRQVMADLEDRLGKDLDWYAVQHRNTDDPHVHVVLHGTGTNREAGREETVNLTPADFKAMRESGREHSDYEHYHLIRDTLRELDERDTIAQEIPIPEREYVPDHGR